jgi:hypothetical protein
MIRTDLVQPLYLGLYATYWRYGTTTTVRVKNSNGVWCCLTHHLADCECVVAVQIYDKIFSHDERLFPRATLRTHETDHGPDKLPGQTPV